MKNKAKKTKPVEHPHVVPKEYLDGCADSLWRINPTKRIVLNTITSIWKEGYNRGYLRKHEEAVRFRNKKNATFEAEFKLFKTYLDDLLHDTSGNKYTFEEWMEYQKKPRNINKQTK